MLLRKNIMLTAFVITLSIISFSSAVVLLKRPICQGKYLPFMRKWVHLLMPPKDLYETIIDEPLDISSVGNKTFVFSLKYTGPYSIELFPRNISDELSGAEYATPLKATVEFHIDEKLVLEKDISYEKSWGLGRGKGIPQCEIDVPLELPIEKSIICIVKITVPDAYLGKKCDWRVFMRKRSEL